MCFSAIKPAKKCLKTKNSGKPGAFVAFYFAFASAEAIFFLIPSVVMEFGRSIG